MNWGNSSNNSRAQFAQGFNWFNPFKRTIAPMVNWGNSSNVNWGNSSTNSRVQFVQRFNLFNLLKSLIGSSPACSLLFITAYTQYTAGLSIQISWGGLGRDSRQMLEVVTLINIFNIYI